MQAARTAIATGVFATNIRMCMHLLLTDSLRAWASIRRELELRIILAPDLACWRKWLVNRAGFDEAFIAT
jgi:hypothetical protein